MRTRKFELREIASIFAGLPTKSSSRRDVGRSGNILTVRALAGDGIDLDQLETHEISDRDAERYRIEAGDLLISSRSTSLKAVVVPNELDGRVINATLIGIRPSSSILLPRLLVAWLESPDGQAELAAVSQSGTTQMNVTVGGLSRLQVPVPDISIQKRLEDLLFAADEAYRLETEIAEKRRRIVQEIVTSQLGSSEK